MSKVKIEGNASGTGTLTISAPNTNTDRSLTLPDTAGEVLVNGTTSNVGINTTSPTAKLHILGENAAAAVKIIGGSTNGYYNLEIQNSATNGYGVGFKDGGSIVGSITTTGSATSYNTSSDYRLKENVVAMTDATTRLKQLQPKRFNFIADADMTVDGFLAHEVQSIVPEAITGTHNEIDDDGNPVYQGIDQSKLVPLLVKTIQELESRITALENA